ncbi:hypothetical protein PUN28_008762 [Cardiocondyla obscurior]|uniref:Uncharacterized protein n=1 Tax=Cardiocondyla obscurior TaxID=286306 RepID=A0AAW2FQV7_9HYME
MPTPFLAFYLHQKNRDIDKNEKKFLKIWHKFRAVTSANAHVTIFSVLPSPEAEILTKNKKNFENLATYHCAVTCPRDHFQRSTLSRNTDIDEKQKKKFLKIWQRIVCGDVSRCPRDHFQRQRY